VRGWSSLVLRRKGKRKGNPRKEERVEGPSRGTTPHPRVKKVVLLAGRVCPKKEHGVSPAGKERKRSQNQTLPARSGGEEVVLFEGEGLPCVEKRKREVTMMETGEKPSRLQGKTWLRCGGKKGNTLQGKPLAADESAEKKEKSASPSPAGKAATRQPPEEGKEAGSTSYCGADEEKGNAFFVEGKKKEKKNRNNNKNKGKGEKRRFGPPPFAGASKRGKSFSSFRKNLFPERGKRKREERLEPPFLGKKKLPNY